MSLKRILIPLGLLLALAACTSTPSPAGLTATLVDGDNVALSWPAPTPTPAGEVVEYSNTANGDYTPLDFLPPNQTSYAHDKLIPDTAFYYRVVPYSGPTTNAVTVDLPPGAADENAANAWATPATLPGPAPHASVHTPAGAPTGLTATIQDANGIKLTWTDNDTDAAGYFVEIKPPGSSTFQVNQVLAPHINTCGIITLPDEKHATIRIRAVYYGTPSNTAMQHTAAGAS
ncbi:MAG TPA: fibronectin type III domain-containing protein [Pseudonocardiaceae bacterium]|nr:fibronectin type III domain-containing protein [Pseudonocardiaceae bacterium]